MNYIVIITDCYDVAFNEIRAKIIGELRDKVNNFQIEPAVEVKELSLINCAFLIRLMAEIYPPNTTFLVLCSPTKYKPDRIYGVTKKKNIRFFGTNNGVLAWFLEDFGIKEIYLSKNRKNKEYLPFGGKWDYAPSTAKIAMANNLKSLKLGRRAKIQEIEKFDIRNGTILHIDNFGLCKIKGSTPMLKEGTRLQVHFNRRVVGAVYCKRMMSLPDKTTVLYPGSSLNMPEFGIVRGNAAKKFNLKIGDKISWTVKG